MSICECASLLLLLQSMPILPFLPLNEVPSWLCFSESVSQAVWQRGHNVQVWIYAVSVLKEIKDSKLRKVLLLSRCCSGSTKTCPRWYLLLQIASKSYRHLKIANYLIPVMLTIPVRKQFQCNSCAVMVFSCLPLLVCLTYESDSSPLPSSYEYKYRNECLTVLCTYM